MHEQQRSIRLSQKSKSMGPGQYDGGAIQLNGPVTGRWTDRRRSSLFNYRQHYVIIQREA